MRNVRVLAYFVVALVFASSTFFISAPAAQAAQITNRSLQLLTGGSGNGGSMPGGTVNHRFEFRLGSTHTIGSIKFEYCTVASVVACVAPTGLNASSATFGGETGSAVTGFSMGTTTANSFILTRVPASAAANAIVVAQANNVVNPTATNQTFFTRITTYSSNNATGGIIDSGSVAASTANPIQLTGVMPESLIFCTGATISAPGNIPDCSTATPGNIDFNQLFSPTDTATASSQMAASTNAQYGYVITVNGPSMTSGSSVIPAMAPAAPDAPVTSLRGTSQFGMNMRANTTAVSTVAVGADVSLAPNGADLRGQATPNYAVVDKFKYVSGDPVARSDNGGAGPTNAQLYTASYIVNAAGNLLAGTYTTTLTYVCTPTF